MDSKELLEEIASEYREYLALIMSFNDAMKNCLSVKYNKVIDDITDNFVQCAKRYADALVEHRKLPAPMQSMSKEEFAKEYHRCDEVLSISVPPEAYNILMGSR